MENIEQHVVDITNKGIRRKTYFIGKRRVGLDTNVFIKLYDQPYLFEHESTKILNQRDTLFIHKISIRELARYIMRKKKISEENAQEEAKQFVKDKNIKKIYYFIPKEEIQNFELESNKKLQTMGKIGLTCHYPDSIILLGFKKFNINKVISTDEAFRICATFLDMDAASLPSLDYVTSRALREALSKRKRRWKRH